MRDHRAAVRQLPLFEERVAGVTMNTTGLARETIAGLYEGDALALALRDARARTLAIYSLLDLDHASLPCIPTVNPPIWELAHLAWFQEYWCLRYERECDGPVRPSMFANADPLFDSRVIAHDARWELQYEPAKTLRRYMDDALDATLAALARTPESERYYFALALLHEDMHGEALLMTLQTMGWELPAISSPAPRSEPPTARDVVFEGGEFAMGTAPGHARFVFDNEKWAHPVHVAPFAISATPVTAGEFAQFVQDGGYDERSFWSDAGWQWRALAQAEAPHHWRREHSRWHVRHFSEWRELELAAPMMHVCLHEAEAYCRWAGRRLPTEAEWEYAARNGGRGDAYPWGDDAVAGGATDLRFSGPSLAVADAAPPGSGVHGLIGGVWEWTSSPFTPYPEFAPDPYRDYSQPWFHSHYAMRGGSFATRSRLVHNRFRNFYLPGRNDVFAGFRTCALEAA
jgi:ergothioneine biosynthesis protein EgtB